MARKCFAILDRLDGCIYCPAFAVPENQDEGCAQDSDSVFEATYRIVVGKIAGYAAHKEISPTGVERVFRSHARIGASQDSGEWILSDSQCGTLGNEVMRFHFTLYVATIPFHQELKRRIRRKHVLWFWRGADLSST